MSSSQLKVIKYPALNLRQSNNLDGLLIADDKGFEIHNSGFQQAHHLHSLKQLSNFFFPGKTGTVVGIEAADFTVIIRETEDGKMVATKQGKKESQ